MADIRLMRPGAGEVQNITCAPEARFIFDFPTDEATLSRSGDNLVITFEDGATLQLENFYTAYSSKNMPSFEVEGAEISGEDFFTAMNEPDLMPAAGPGGNAGAQSNGNRFHSYVNSELLGGLDRLGGLDIGWNDGGQDSELDGGGGGHVDFGVTLTGESGEVPDPSIPVIDDPTYPDQPGWDQTVTGRDVLNVKESELDGAGSRSVDHGSLLVDARDGVASIVIDGVTVYEGTEPPVLHADARVNTDEGYLTNFRYSAATGRLEYDYVLTQATTEHKGEGKDSIAHNFHVTVTDTDGDTGTGLITVVIEDDVPLAADDAAGLEENEIVSGNVVTGEVDTTGTEEGFVSVGKDDYGADAAAPTNGLVWNLDSWGEKASYDAATETWTVVTDYGTATLHADGSFTFDALKNAGLDEGVSASMNFDYTITDADGDSSSATLTVTVTGDTQPVVTFDKPGADSNAITVDEALLPGGNAGHSDSDAHEPEGEGSFTVNFKGESGDVTLTYGKDESAQTVTLRLEQGRQEVVLSEDNTLIVNGVTVTVTGAVYDAASGEWIVNYTYNLAAGQDHGNDKLIGDDDVLSGTIDITVKDDTDDTATGSLQVTVHDDGPMVTLVPTEYEDKNYFNTVSVSFGADNDTDDSSLAVKAYEVDADGQNPRLITWTKGDGSTTTDLSSLSQGEWTSVDGNIIVSRENGNFVFKIKENGTNADITVTATDADGDTDSKTLHLTAPDSDSNEIIVDEALLSDGSIVNSDKSAHAASGTGSFTVDLHGEDGTVTLTYDTGETTGENTEKNLPTVTLSLINNDDFDLDSWLSSKNMQDPMLPNTFVVKGVTVTVTGATQQQPNGPWQIEYSYVLNGEQAHPLGASDNDGGKIGADDSVSDSIGIRVTDATGDTATGSLTVTVHDDGPVLNGLSNSTGADAMLNESTGPFVVSLDGFHTGADMVNGTTPAKVTVAVGGQTYTFTVSSGTHGYVFTPVAGQGNAVSIEHGENGYELHYTRPEGDVQSSGTSSYTFTVTVTDADGDSVSENITLTTKDRPDISFGTTDDSVKEAGVEGCEVPAESTSPDDPNAEVSGDPEASGTITLTDTDSTALTLTVTGSVQHTDGHASGLPTPSLTTWNGTTLSVAASRGGTLTLYLNADGELVTSQPSDYYGTLTLDFSDGKTGNWNFMLNEGSDLVDSLKEGESFDITLKLKATDADDYSSTEAALTIHIQGTNDMPVFTSEVTSVGDIVVTDTVGGVDNVPNSISGTLKATDADADNGAGSDIASVNDLTFTVAGFNADASAVGKVSVGEDGKISYTPYGESSAGWHNLVSTSGTVKGPETDADGRKYTSVTTQYGTLKVYTDGSYTYTPKDTSKIGGDEYVTETFVVRVTDAHGSFSEKTITITLRDENNGITGGAEISQSLREEGVVGDDPSLGAPSKGANIYVPRSDGTAVNEGTTVPNNVLFTDADVNDTVTLTIGGTDVSIRLAGGEFASSVGSIAEHSVTVGIVGSSSTVLYLVATETSDGKWNFSWKGTTTTNDDVVGKLTLSREIDGDVSYSFALDPKNTNKNIVSDNSDFLDQLAQGDTVNINLGFTAGEATSHVDLTITGTNDQPVIDRVVKSGESGETTVNGGKFGAIITEIYGESQGNDADISGRVVAHDVDSDNGAGSTDGEGNADNRLSFTVTTKPSGSTENHSSAPEGTLTTIETAYGKLIINQDTGEFTYTMDDPELVDGKPNAIMALGNGQSVTETYTVRVTDAHGSYSTTTITFTIRGTNDRPILTSETLEVHAAENNTPDITYHEDEVDHSTDQAHASDPDVNDAAPTFCFALGNNDGSVTDPTQSVAITAGELLSAVESKAEIFNGQSSTLEILKAWLESAPEGETVATLNITADGKLSLTLNQNSDFIEALNGEDSFTFNLSDISNLQVYAKDKGGLYSSASNDVKLVIHGTDDAYVVTSAQNPHVKESGVYREKGQKDGNTETIPDSGTAYGQEKDSAAGSFTLAGRDAGQVVFTVKNNSYSEHSTTLTQGTAAVSDDVSVTFGDSSSATVMYVAGAYGYYEISLDSTMDAAGTRTFTYEYHLYSGEYEELPEEVQSLLGTKETFSELLKDVNALPQGANVSDSVTIDVTIGTTSSKFNLQASVSGTNDRPEINELAVANPKNSDEVALGLGEPAEGSNSFMSLDGDTLSIQVDSDDGDTFVGSVVGIDPDQTNGSNAEGTRVINYSFTIAESGTGGTQVWTLSDDGQTLSSEYGHITIDNSGRFTLHINQEAIKSLGDGVELKDIFNGLYVQCTDDLGATSNRVELSGTLLGRNDSAYLVSNTNNGLWEADHSAHDNSLPPTAERPGGAGIVEHSSSQLKGSLKVHDPDSSDTFDRSVTVTVDGNRYTVTFGDHGSVISVNNADGNPVTDVNGNPVIPGEHGTFGGLRLEITDNNATLHYEYTVTDAAAKEDINALNDGETYKDIYGSDLEDMTVSFTSKNGDAVTGTLDTHITVDVHGSNDAPVIKAVTIGGTEIDVTDNGAINGGEVGYQGSAEGVITVFDPDDDKAVRPSEGDTTGGTSGTGATDGRLLQIGFLVYHDGQGNEVLVYGKTGTDGITRYYRMDGGNLPDNVTLADLTFSQQADLAYGTIYVNDYGEYIYSRNPNDTDASIESVYVTVKDQHGAMDSVKIEFTNAEVIGDGGHLPDVSISDVDVPNLTEPSPDGGLVVAGEESGVASSFDEGGNPGTLIVQCWQDGGKYIPVYKDGNTWKTQGGDTVEASGFEPTPIYARLENVNGEYQWKYYTDEEFTTSVDANDMVSPSLDFRLTDDTENATFDNGVYSLSTDYGTVYVNKDTGELRFELDSRADALSAGEVKEETVYLWVNGKKQSVTLQVTGTGDASEVTSTDLTAALAQADEDGHVRVADGTITVADIDKNDEHNLVITGVDGQPIPVGDSGDVVIYVMRDANGSVYYTTRQPGDNEQDCYGKLTVSKTSDGNYSYSFDAWADTKAGKEIKPGHEKNFVFNVQVTDDSPEAEGDRESAFHDKTTSDGSFTVTVVGKADAVEFDDSQAHINEEGVPGTVDEEGNVSFPGTASGALSVSGNLGVKDFDQSGYTVTASVNGSDYSSVVKGQYGTLILNDDGTYSYVLDYGKCQGLGEKDIVNDVFTVKVHNSAEDVTHTLTVTVHGVNDLPVVTVTPALSVQEGLPSVEGKPNSGGTATGKVDAQDVDESDTLSYGIMVDGEFVVAQPGAEGSSDAPATVYVVGTWGDDGELTLSTTTQAPDAQSLVGTLTMNASGEYTFTVADSAMAQSLNGGKSESITVNIGANDGHETVTKPVTITIHGTNEAPEIESALTTSESTVTTATEEGDSYSVTFSPAAPEAGEVDDGYTVTDADWGDTLTYTFEQGGRYFTSSDAVISINGKDYTVSLSIGADGTITMTYDDDVKNAIDALGEGETAKLTSQINLVVQDGFGGKTSSPLTISVSGENDAVVITADQNTANIEIVDGATSLPEGSFTFTDVDVNDKHTVTLPTQTVQVMLPNGETAQATVENGVVTLNDDAKTVLGTLKIYPVQEPANGESGKVTYTFEPISEYLTGLGTGEEVKLDLTFTVTELNNGVTVNTMDQAVTITLTGSNDEVIISSDESTLTPDKNGEYQGSFTFTDADVKDTHSVSSSVQVKLPDSEEAVSAQVADNGVVTLDGTVLGTLEVTRNNDSTGGETGQVSYTFKPSSDYLTSLGKGESTQLDLVFTVSDGNGSEKTTSVSVTLEGSNDAVSISSDNFSTTPNEDGVYTGSLVFSDKDVSDTHTVTFKGLYGNGGESKAFLSVDTSSMPTDAVSVYDEDGVLIGTMGFTFTKGENNQNNELTYTFTPVDPNSLPVGDHSVNFTVSVDDGNESTDSVDEPYTITITNENDEVNISSDDASLTPNNRVYEGSLVFSDADVTDTHTVTFEGLYGSENGTALSVNTAELSETSSSVEVYNAEGGKIGTMEFDFVEGSNNQGNELTYTFTPDAELTENLSAEVSVSDGHETEAAPAPTVNVTFNKPDVPEGSGDGSEAEEEQTRMNQENGLLTAAMVVSGLNGVLDASFDAPLFDAQTDAPDVPEGQDVFAVDSLVLPDAPDAPAFAVADASAEHAAPQMFSLHADPAIPEATMHESAVDVPEASPADDASSDAPDLISLLADSDPGTPEHGFLFGAPEGDVFSGSDGNDYMAGGDGSDAVMAGDGNDIVVYDGNDYLIDGGSGIDFIVSNDDSLSLNKLLTESGRDGHTGPIVNGVEVLIKGDDALSLTSMDQLSKDYGVTIGHDAQGNETLTLNADQWHANGDGSFDYVGQPGVDLTLETSLTPVTHDDAADAAVQQQVFILQNTQG